MDMRDVASKDDIHEMRRSIACLDVRIKHLPSAGAVVAIAAASSVMTLLLIAAAWQVIQWRDAISQLL